jgi:hypothetical protein
VTVADDRRRYSFRTRWQIGIRLSDLDASVRACAYSLSTWMNAEGRCDPSYVSIGAGAGQSTRTAIRAVKTLERRAWIDVRRTRGGRRNTYQAMLPSGVAELIEATLNRDTRTPFGHSTMTPTTANGDRESVSTVTPVSPELLGSALKERAAAAAPDGAAALDAEQIESKRVGLEVLRTYRERRERAT